MVLPCRFRTRGAWGYHNRTMEKAVRIFGSHQEADEADREYFRNLTPQQRLNIFLEVLWRGRNRDEAAERLERVYRIVELSQS